jgi:hypothetical protein
MQMVQLSAIRCSCIAILLVSIVNFAAITLWRGQQRVIPKVGVYFIIDSVRKLLNTPSYIIPACVLVLTHVTHCVLLIQNFCSTNYESRNTKIL